MNIPIHMKDDLDRSAKVRELYSKDKVFKKLFDLMFIEFGWAATEIDADILKIYKIVKKYKKQELRCIKRSCLQPERE